MDPVLIIGIAAGALALIGAVYGALRKFSRLTWIGWQILIAFGLDILVSFLPDGMNISVYILFFIVIVALPLVGEYFLRKALVTDRVLKPGTGEKVFDRIFGAVTAIVGVLMFFIAIGGLGLGLADTFTEGPLLDAPIWDFFSKYVLDLFLISLFMVVMRAGCRLGVLKGMYFFLIIALLFGAFFSMFLLFSQVGWGLAFSNIVGGWFGYKGSLASIVGCVAVTGFFSLILFVGIMFLSKLLDWSIQKVNSHQVIELVDALLLGAVFTAVFLIALMGVQGVIGALTRGNFLGSLVNGLPESVEESMGSVDSTLAEIANKFADFAKSSAISRGIYMGNPFIG